MLDLITKTALVAGGVVVAGIALSALRGAARAEHARHPFEVPHDSPPHPIPADDAPTKRGYKWWPRAAVDYNGERAAAHGGGSTGTHIGHERPLPTPPRVRELLPPPYADADDAAERLSRDAWGMT